MERDFSYESEHLTYEDEQYPEGGIQCKNYVVCNTVLPKWWFDCKSNYLCTNCDMLFGQLEVKDRVPCPLCLEEKTGVAYTGCTHVVCIDCFKQSFYGDKSGFPVFPYPEIEQAYYEDAENPKWEHEYPFIRLYNEEWYTWDDRRVDSYDPKKSRRCPICL
jgi:hypothetical protein